jgi:hypothetical protein
MELPGWTGPSRGIPAQSTAAAGAYRVRVGSRGRGSTERQGSGTRSGTGRFVPTGSGSDAPEYAHSLHSTVEGAHRAGSRLRTITRRSVIGRPGKIKAIEELGAVAIEGHRRRAADGPDGQRPTRSGTCGDSSNAKKAEPAFRFHLLCDKICRESQPAHDVSHPHWSLDRDDEEQQENRSWES